MPLYDFECKKCDTIIEVLTSFNNDVHCESCGDIMNRLISRPGKININDSFINSHTPSDDSPRQVAMFPEYRDKNTNSFLGYGKAKPISEE